jgi:hypothetical protein
MNIPETLKMPSFCGLGKRPQGILRNQRTRGFFGLSLIFKTVSGMFVWFVSNL